jgi:hypothetical protein
MKGHYALIGGGFAVFQRFLPERIDASLMFTGHLLIIAGQMLFDKVVSQLAGSLLPGTCSWGRCCC